MRTISTTKSNFGSTVELAHGAIDRGITPTLFEYPHDFVENGGGSQPAYDTTVPEIFVLKGHDMKPMPSTFVWDYKEGKLNPNYTLLITRLGLFPDVVLTYKHDGYQAFKCKNTSCKLDTVYRPIITCGYLHPWVSTKHSNRCTNQIMPRLEFMRKLGSDYLICIDLTIPDLLRHKANPERTIVLLNDATRIFIDKLRKIIFPAKKSKLGGFFAVHIWKTTHPLDSHFHVHLQIFNVAAEGKQLHRFSPKLNSCKVRKAWLASLQEVDRKPKGTLDISALLDTHETGWLPDVHLHYIKMTDTPRLIHRLNYIYRRPISDLNDVLTASDLKAFDEVWAKHLIEYTPRQTFIGFATRLKSMGFICPKYFPLLCPLCGQPMEKGKILTEIPLGTPRLIQLKGTMWKELPESALKRASGAVWDA